MVNIKSRYGRSILWRLPSGFIYVAGVYCKMKNPILFFLVWVFILINIVDVSITFTILPAEANPLYLLTKNIYLLILFKLGIISLIILFYKRGIYPNNFSYFMVISILGLGIMVVTMAVYSNLHNVVYHPDLVQEAAKIPVKEKLIGYTSFVSIFFILPFAVNLLVFYLYDKSHKYIMISKSYYKQKKWWQL